MAFGIAAGAVGEQVTQGCLQNSRVFLQIPDPDVAVAAQDAPYALPAGSLPRRAAGVVVVNMPAAGTLATRLSPAADGAPLALSLESGIELTLGQAVVAQAFDARLERGVFLTVIAHPGRHAWAAVRRGRGELMRWLRGVASRAVALGSSLMATLQQRGILGVALAGYPVIRAVDGASSRLYLEGELVVADRASTSLSVSHFSSIRCVIGVSKSRKAR